MITTEMVRAVTKMSKAEMAAWLEAHGLLNLYPGWMRLSRSELESEVLDYMGGRVAS